MISKKSKMRLPNSPTSDNELLYCICRSSDGTRFMIACDNCEEWFHGDCINVTPKEAANIKRFFCYRCIGRFPNLQIEYKMIRKERQVKRPRMTCSEDEDEGRNDANSSSSDQEARVGFWRPPVATAVQGGIEDVGAKKRGRGRPRERREAVVDEEATEDEVETCGLLVVPSASPGDSRAADTYTRCGDAQGLEGGSPRKRRLGPRTHGDRFSGASDGSPGDRVARRPQREWPGRVSMMGSKMRRGDVLPHSRRRRSPDGDDEGADKEHRPLLGTRTAVPRRHNPRASITVSCSNLSPGSSFPPLRTGTPATDSDDSDVMIPPELLSPAASHRGIDHRLAYGLCYGDHLYCKHHRFWDWHAHVPDNPAVVDTPCTPGPGSAATATATATSTATTPHDSTVSDRLARRVRPTFASSASGTHTLPGEHRPTRATRGRGAPLDPEFYTINDGDDLEINWPKEAVNA